MIKLNYIHNTVATELILPDDLVLSGNMDSSSVYSEYTRSLGGTLIIETTIGVSDGKLSLKGSESNGWVDKTKADEILDAISTVSEQMVLTVNNGDTFNVVFDRQDRSTIKPLFNRSDYNSDTIYIININFIRVD